MKRTVFKEEHELFRKSIQRFLDEEAMPYYKDWEKEKQVPRSFWKKMGEQGFLAPQVAEKYGGMGTNFLYNALLSEEYNRVGSGLGGVGVHSDITVPYIEPLAVKKLKSHYLPKLVSGEMICGIAMTEPGTGSDLANVKTTAVLEGDHYIVNGEKTFITNGYYGDLFVVVCKTDPNAEPARRGISLLLVEAEYDGFSRGKKLEKLGQHANDTSELVFENVKVPKENLLGEENKAFYYLMEKLQQERLMLSISSINTAKIVLDQTIDYVKERKAFGTPISKFQNTQFKIAEMKSEIEIGRTFVDRLIEEHTAGNKVVNEVSMAKWWVTSLYKRVVNECLQLHGGYGYTEEYDVARRYRDAAVTSIYAGSNEIMKVIIAKNEGL
ncbi:LOW QUALITY PROTEIN: butyryl-CoA dehydrogenase [Geomicrobium sp. JCM 19055]|nr:LOW QUALITY PROTEIN: butyryl-CoA dehydrogenase [Geomicrobium sp. JCM 19055]